MRGPHESRGQEMAFKQDPGIASGDAVLLDELNFAEIVKGLPAKARMVLSAAMNLPRGHPASGP